MMVVTAVRHLENDSRIIALSMGLYSWFAINTTKLHQIGNRSEMIALPCDVHLPRTCQEISPSVYNPSRHKKQALRTKNTHNIKQKQDRQKLLRHNWLLALPMKMEYGKQLYINMALLSKTLANKPNRTTLINMEFIFHLTAIIPVTVFLSLKTYVMFRHD